MSFNLAEILSDSLGRARNLHEQYMNPVFSNVLEMIGFNHEYTQGQGAYIHTLDGRKIFDALSGYGVYGIGRNHPQMKEALTQALQQDFANLVQMDTPLLSGLLAEKLIKLAPGNRLEHVFFTNSGTEAVEGSIKFARATTGRQRILFNKRAFHGLTTGSLALNGDDSFRAGFGDLLPGCEKVDLHELHCVITELKTKTVAAVILEPICGKGVFYPNEPEIYQSIQNACRETGTMLIVDEIQTGLGRTGKWWASEHWDIEPDIMTTSKALSGGMVPVGAMLYSDQIYRKVYNRLDRCVVHSSTFGQNCLAMVAGLAAISIIEEENLVQRSQQLGDYMMSSLERLQEKHEFIAEIRGKGLMIGIQFGSPKSFRLKPAWALLHTAEKGLFAQAVAMQLFSEHNILTQVSGHQQEIIKLLPPFIMTEAEADHIMNAFDQVLEECKKFPGPVWSVGKQLAGAAAKQQLRARQIHSKA